MLLVVLGPMLCQAYQVHNSSIVTIHVCICDCDVNMCTWDVGQTLGIFDPHSL